MTGASFSVALILSDDGFSKWKEETLAIWNTPLHAATERSWRAQNRLKTWFWRWECKRRRFFSFGGICQTKSKVDSLKDSVSSHQWKGQPNMLVVCRGNKISMMLQYFAIEGYTPNIQLSEVHVSIHTTPKNCMIQHSFAHQRPIWMANRTGCEVFNKVYNWDEQPSFREANCLFQKEVIIIWALEWLWICSPPHPRSEP